MKASRVRGLTIGLFSILGVVLLTQGLITYHRALWVGFDFLLHEALTNLVLSLACVVAAGVMGCLTRERRGAKRQLLPMVKKASLSALIIGLLASNLYFYVFHVYDYGPPITRCNQLAHSASTHVKQADAALYGNASITGALHAAVGNLTSAVDDLMLLAQLDRWGKENLTRMAMSIKTIQDCLNLTITVLAAKNETLAWQALNAPLFSKGLLSLVAYVLYFPGQTMSLACVYKMDAYYRRKSPGYYPYDLGYISLDISRKAVTAERWALEWLKK